MGELSTRNQQRPTLKQEKVKKIFFPTR